MKLVKPSWVHHDEKPIFSIDVHQECLKFATGGQGLDSGRVVIWNLLPVLCEKSEQDPNVPKVLCQMDQHLGCVNCVRWSQNGQLLASGSDDKLVMIWRKSSGTSGVFGTGGIKKNPETWRCVYTLRGHAGDVLDLAWSPQDQYLASCSIDNTVIVWDARSFPIITATLKGHMGLVKGVSWDPVGKFLASQSDDRSIKIWKTSNWSCSTTIKEPFEECGGTTHILRLCWSPDGQYLVSAHAMNSGGPTAQIIEREGWKCNNDFVGHRKAVTCVRFNNAILKRKVLGKGEGKPQQYCCLAVGSRDRSLSVWITALQRPMVVIHELFNDSVLDLSWGPERCILMACSGDGTVACLQFSDDELGLRISNEHKSRIFQRMYGKSVLLENNGLASTTSAIIENPDFLNCSSGPIKPPALPQLGGSMPAPAAMPAPTCSVRNGSNTAMSVKQSASPMKAISKQSETRTADGKRRITPMFIPMNQDAGEGFGLTSSSRSMTASLDTSADAAAATIVRVEDDNDKDFCNPALDSRLIMSTNKNKQPMTFSFEELKDFPRIFTNRPVRKPVGPTVTNTHVYQASTVGPKMQITATTKCEFYKAALDYRISVQNGSIQTSHGALARIIAYNLNKDQVLWENFVGSPVVNFNFCIKYALFCSLDGTIRLFDVQTGCSMLPVVMLTTAGVQCSFSPDCRMVGVITECGLLRIWNIEEQRVLLGITCQEVLGKFGAVLHMTVTNKGIPIVAFANGSAYSYSKRLQSWLVLNTKDPVTYNGLRTTLPRELQKNIHVYPLLTTQASTFTYASLMNAAEMNNTSNWQSISKVTFIENQIKICEAIDSPEELKYWYNMLVFHLASCGIEERMRLLLDDLLGTPMTNIEDHKILSISKYMLLEGALETLKPHPQFQRIYTEYMELYKSLKQERSCLVGSVGEKRHESSKHKKSKHHKHKEPPQSQSHGHAHAHQREDIIPGGEVMQIG